MNAHSDIPSPAVEPAERSLVDDVRQLADHARDFAKAELAYQQSRAKLAGTSAGGIAGRLALAGALVFFALMGLVFGAILGLTPWLTAWGATAVVVGVLVICALALALAARSRWRRLSGLIAGKEPPK